MLSVRGNLRAITTVDGIETMIGAIVIDAVAAENDTTTGEGVMIGVVIATNHASVTTVEGLHLAETIIVTIDTRDGATINDE